MYHQLKILFTVTPNSFWPGLAHRSFFVLLISLQWHCFSSIFFHRDLHLDLVNMPCKNDYDPINTEWDIKGWRMLLLLTLLTQLAHCAVPACCVSVRKFFQQNLTVIAPSHSIKVLRACHDDLKTLSSLTFKIASLFYMLKPKLKRRRKNLLVLSSFSKREVDITRLIPFCRFKAFCSAK